MCQGEPLIGQPLPFSLSLSQGLLFHPQYLPSAHYKVSGGYTFNITMALNCHCIPMQLGTIHSHSSPLLILRENQYMSIGSRPLIQNLRNSDLVSGGRQKLKQISVQKICANSNDENPSTVEAGPEGLDSSSSKIDKKAQEREAVKKGQTTAIITGAISVILGVGYLLLVQLLDTRGVILVPPPPEAFDP